MFKAMQQSQYILDHYLTYSNRLQRLIDNLLMNGLSANLVAAMLELRDKAIDTGQNFDEVKLHATELTVVPNMKLLDHQMRAEKLVKTIHSNKVNRYMSLMEDVMTAILIVYGLTELETMVDRWTAHTTNDNLEKFIQIALRWDEFKDYPIDWSLHMIGAN